MATALKAEENPLAGIGDLTNLIQLFTGQKTTTSTSQAGMQALLNNLISGTQGLSAVTSGSKVAGGYNSAAQTMLTNDFLTRAAAQASAGTTTKQTAPAVSGSNALLGLGLAAGKSLLGPTVKRGLQSAGISTDNIGGQISDAIFGASTGGADVATSAAWATGQGIGQDVLGSIGGSLIGEIGTDVALDAALDIGAIAIEGIGDASLDAASWLAEGVDAASFGIPWFTLANIATNGMASQYVMDAGENIGQLFSDIFGGIFS